MVALILKIKGEKFIKSRCHTSTAGHVHKLNCCAFTIFLLKKFHIIVDKTVKCPTYFQYKIYAGKCTYLYLSVIYVNENLYLISNILL